MDSGLWVVIEGSDACGKSTLINTIAVDLARRIEGTTVFLTREPGSLHSPLTTKFRELLGGQDTEPPAFIAETMLYLADRAHHYQKVVIPALNHNKIVVQDRGYLSTIVYQSGLRQFPASILLSLHRLIMDTRLPDIVFWLDTPLDITLDRLKTRKSNIDDITTFDLETMQEAIYNGYRQLYEDPSNPQLLSSKIVRLSGLLSATELSRTVCDTLISYMANATSTPSSL